MKNQPTAEGGGDTALRLRIRELEQALASVGEQAAPEASSVREKLLESELSAMKLVMGAVEGGRDFDQLFDGASVETLKNNLRMTMKTCEKRQKEIDRLKAQLATKPMEVRAPGVPSDLDQTEEGEDQRRGIGVGGVKLLPNGFPVGKTMGADGSLVDAEEAGF